MTRDLLEFMGNIALRVTVVLAAAGIISLILRRASAALRHWVWVLAMSAALLMPALVLAAPQWNITLPTSATQPNSDVPQTNNLNPNSPLLNPTPLPANNNNVVRTAAQNNVLDATPLPQNQNADVAPAPAQNSTADAPASAKKSDGFNLPQARTWLLILWIEGALVVLVIGFRQYWKVKRLINPGMVESPSNAPQSTSVDFATIGADFNLRDKDADILPDILKTLNIRRPVQLIVSPAVSIPMTLGLRRPIILLPIESAEWDDARRRVVLLHECIHIARYDALMGWLSLILCAVHWFNPLAWLAARRLNTEGELACDDRVLQLGTTGPDYAQHLVEIARHALPASSSPSPITPGLAKMAVPGNLGVRVNSILDKRRQRSAPRWQRFLGLLLVVTLITPLLAKIENRVRPTAYAQEITLTVAIPETAQDTLPADLLADFEADHGVNVEWVIDDSTTAYSTLVDTMDDYFAKVANLADSADVIFPLITPLVSPQATRAGYFLDLTALAAADPTYDKAAYFPAASYEWEGGLWGLPLTLDPLFFLYDKTAFDAAGLAYPATDWTWDDFVATARALSVIGPDGTVIRPGFQGDPMFLFRSLLGRPFNATDLPHFSTDTELMALVNEWEALEEEGIVSRFMAIAESPEDSHLPFLLTGAWIQAYLPKTEFSYALLPGNHAGNRGLTGFVVSAGTQNPELAYALAKYLTDLPGLANYLDPFALPAQPALVDSSNKVFESLPPELADFLVEAGQVAFPPRDTLFVDYYNLAMGHIPPIAATMQEAFILADARAEAEFAAVEAHRAAGVVVNVAPPPVQVVAPDGEIVLRFHLGTMQDRLPTYESWERVATDFAATDPDVYAVELQTGEMTSETDNPDCYLGQAFGESYEFFEVLNLDPLIQADANFDPADFVPGSLAEFEADGLTWGYPLMVQPTVMWLQESLFIEAGLPVPSGEWDISEFTAALSALAERDLANQYPFTPSIDGPDMLMLAAAFGGLPLDFSTQPATIRLSDPTNVAALQQVLDLAKNGLVHYQLPFSSEGSPAGVITADSLYNLSNYLPMTRIDNGVGIVNYPHGTQYTPISYITQGGFIKQTAQNVEACYRWLSTIAEHPELLMGVPARRSQAENPIIATAFGPDIAAAYAAFNARLDDPNLVIMPHSVMVGSSWLGMAEIVWINQAFMDYIENDTDLATLLTETQGHIDTYQACLATQPPSEDYQAALDHMRVCVESVDPTIVDVPPLSFMFAREG